MTLTIAFFLAMAAVIVPASASCASEVVYTGRTQGDQYEMYDLYKVESETGAITQLTSTTDVQEGSPLWSPDRSRIAFWNMSGGDDLFVMNADGNEVRRINRSVKEDAGFRPDPNASIHLSGFDWSPSGTRLVYARSIEKADRCPEVEVEPRGYIAKIRHDGSSSKLLTGTHGTFSNPAWSPDGRKILYTRQTRTYGNNHLMIMNSDGSNKRRLVSGRGSHSYFSYAWSPDSRYIAINSEGTNTSVIYVLTPGGGLIGVIDSDTDLLGTPVWAPDGSAIAHQAQQGPDDEGRYTSVLIVSDERGERERRIVSSGVADPYSAYGYDWSPDSKSIVYVREDASTGLDLHLVDVETGVDRGLVQQPDWQTYPDW